MTAQLRWPVTNQKTASRFRSNDLAIADRDPPSSIWLWSSILRLPNPPAEPRGMHKNAQKRITTHEKYRPNPNKWGDGRKYSSSTSPAGSRQQPAAGFHRKFPKTAGHTPASHLLTPNEYAIVVETWGALPKDRGNPSNAACSDRLGEIG